MDVQKEGVGICSEDGYYEKNSRHSLKCDRGRQLPPIGKEKFSYNRFSQFIQAKFLMQSQQRTADTQLGKSTLPITHYTDDVLKKEMVELYGEMDESSERFILIFDNYKEERTDQIRKWIEDEERLKKIQELTVGNLEINEDLPLLDPEIEEIIKICDLRDVFSSDELSVFENVHNYKLSTFEPFTLPRVPLTDPDILQLYGFGKLELNSLTEFDPEISIKKFTLPEICDMNVGEKLAEKMVDIIKKHPTGITNTNFLMEFKKKLNYFPEPISMSYSSFGDMMKDLGEHTIYIQDFPNFDGFYYPMSLQGLICSPREMFWNIWHKIKIILNIHQGIVKASKAIVLCQEMFRFGKLDISAWGFESDDSFITFLIAQWSDQDIELIPESTIKFNGDDHVNYLVLMTEKRKRYLAFHASKLYAKRVTPAHPVQTQTPTSSNYSTKSTQKKSQARRPQQEQRQKVRPQSGRVQDFQRHLSQYQPQFPTPQIRKPLSQYELCLQEIENEKRRAQAISDSILRNTDNLRAPNSPKPRTWSSLLKK